MVDVLTEVGGAQAFGAIEDFVADVAAARQAFFGHDHARAADLVLRHENLAAFLADAIGHVHLFKTRRDLAAVLRAELAVPVEKQKAAGGKQAVADFLDAIDAVENNLTPERRKELDRDELRNENLEALYLEYMRGDPADGRG